MQGLQVGAGPRVQGLQVGAGPRVQGPVKEAELGDDDWLDASRRGCTPLCVAGRQPGSQGLENIFRSSRTVQVRSPRTL